MNFIINEDLLEALDDYHNKTMLMEKHVIEKKYFDGDLESEINDDLIFKVPIYDMGSRKYAAFCSFTEAIIKKENDIKGNGVFFKDHQVNDNFDLFCLFYWFRLCGSGINYKPRLKNLFSSPIGTHGFGNFWIVNSILNKRYNHKEWLEDLKAINIPFTDSKGYLLPQFSFNGISSGHLKKFILDYSLQFLRHLYDFVINKKPEIYQLTDYGNLWLNRMGFKKQNFVLTAFAADISEYFPEMINPKSRVYAGTQAIKCIKAIFPKKNKINEFDYINEVLSFQANRYNLNPIDCEDSRNCDVIRYFKEYQSNDHIKMNGNRVFNNSILKKRIGLEKYYDLIKTL